MMDFTLDAYRMILEAGLKAGYPMSGVSEWFTHQAPDKPIIMLRHDVDRRPNNALAMAHLEHALGVKSTYYFRILPCAYVPSIIEQIRDLGHEIGYHYEDWYLAKETPARAIELFETHLARLRTLAPITSIAMHGSPLAKQNNMTIWEHHDFTRYGVNDAILSFDYTGYVFFTDSGRTFGASSANLRDYLGAASSVPDVRTSADVAAYLAKRPVEHVQLSTHPERWNPFGVAWMRQLALDTAANSVKRVIKRVRNARSS
jgi:hypothetical protein